MDVALVFQRSSLGLGEMAGPYGHVKIHIPASSPNSWPLAVQDQTRWRKLFDIPISLYGGVSGYLNLSRRGDQASHIENQ